MTHSFGYSSSVCWFDYLADQCLTTISRKHQDPTIRKLTNEQTWLRLLLTANRWRLQLLRTTVRQALRLMIVNLWKLSTLLVAFHEVPASLASWLLASRTQINWWEDRKVSCQSIDYLSLSLHGINGRTSIVQNETSTALTWEWHANRKDIVWQETLRLVRVRL